MFPASKTEEAKKTSTFAPILTEVTSIPLAEIYQITMLEVVEAQAQIAEWPPPLWPRK